MKHLKRKNAELAVIAKRLEERARKLQEANLKVVSVSLCVLGPGQGSTFPQDFLFFTFVGTERPPLSSLIELVRPCGKLALYISDRAETTKLNQGKNHHQLLQLVLGELVLSNFLLIGFLL